MNKEYLLNHWYADIYEQKVTETDEAEFVLSLIKESKADIKTILDVCCGGGRNTIPLAKAGYTVTGFDLDEYMLEKLQKRVENENLRNISWRNANALTEEWGKDFDVVFMAGNIFINIITDSDYAEAQELFIKKAAGCVKLGGYFYLDFDCSVYFSRDDKETEFSEWTIFEGIDDIGTYGRFIMMNDDYSDKAQARARRRFEITPKNGETFSFINSFSAKHFPSFEETKGWLTKAGWEIEQLYGGRGKESFDENAEGNRAVIWARKI